MLYKSLYHSSLRVSVTYGLIFCFALAEIRVGNDV